MRPSWLVALSLVAALTVPAALAHASPPDPTWIAGFYDGADLDDVIVAVAALEAAGSGPAPVFMRSLPLIDFVPGEPVFANSPRSAHLSHDRAPPAS
jgi:hypothetical protein